MQKTVRIPKEFMNVGSVKPNCIKKIKQSKNSSVRVMLKM